MNISLYIHFPFCKKKCNYCDFYSVNYTEQMFDSFLASLCKEWEMAQTKYFKSAVIVDTIFLGGGTPSIISNADWLKFNNLFLSKINKSKNCEVTLECNPESFDEDKVENWIFSGVNRLSIGVQSLIDQELEILGRVHNSNIVIELLENPMLKKFSSINIDLMFGIPDQTLVSLQQTLNKILSFDIIKHLSIYELTLSKGTPFLKHKKNFLFLKMMKLVKCIILLLINLKKKISFNTKYLTFPKKVMSVNII